MNKHILAFFGTGSLLMMTACSEVNFTPSNPDAPQESVQATPPPDPGVGLPPTDKTPPVVQPPDVPDVVDKTLNEDFDFNDDSSAKVDILFIVDNSFSMLDSQRKLGDRLASFISGLGGIDWQIGVTTTDTSSGPFGLKGALSKLDGLASKILTKNTPDYINVFKETVVRKESIGCGLTCPSNDERPMEALAGAIAKRDTDNAGFFRSSADLAVVVLSDEDERSHGGSSAFKPDSALAAFASAFGLQKLITAFGLIIEPGDTSCKSQEGLDGAYGTFVDRLAQLTGGQTGSICSADYGPSLQSIGKRIREVSVAIDLKVAPLSSTVMLNIKPFDADLKWSIDGRQIKFNKAPKKGTHIKVSYLAK